MGPIVKLVGRGAAAPVLLSLAAMVVVPGRAGAQAFACAGDSVALAKAVLAARPPALHSARQAELYQALVVWAERQPTPDLTVRAGAFAAAYFGRKGSGSQCAIVHSVVRRALVADDLDREHTLQMVADGSYRGEDPTTLQRIVALEKAVYDASAAGAAIAHRTSARRPSKAGNPSAGKSAPPPVRASATKSAPPPPVKAAATKSAPPPPVKASATKSAPPPPVKASATKSAPPAGKAATKAAPPSAPPATKAAPQPKPAPAATAPSKKPWWSRWLP